MLQQKVFRISNEVTIKASSEKQAKENFANTSFNFAADAKVEEVKDPTETTFIKEIEITDPDTDEIVPVEIHKDLESGGIFGVDSTFTTQVRSEINSPFNNSRIKLSNP